MQEHIGGRSVNYRVGSKVKFCDEAITGRLNQIYKFFMFLFYEFVFFLFLGFRLDKGLSYQFQ